MAVKKNMKYMSEVQMGCYVSLKHRKKLDNVSKSYCRHGRLYSERKHEEIASPNSKD